MSLTTAITLHLATTYTGSLDLSTVRDVLDLNRNISLADGDGADQADMMFSDSRTLADAATETHDIYAGALVDAFGVAVTIEKLKFMYLYNSSSDASLLILGGATPLGICSDASDIIILPPGGKFIWSAPNATGLDVTTNKNLKLEHNGDGSSDLVYEIVLIGVD